MNEPFITEQAINNSGEKLTIEVVFNYAKLEESFKYNLPLSNSIEIYIVRKPTPDYLYAQIRFKEGTSSASIKITDIVSHNERVGNATIMLHYLLKTMEKIEKSLFDNNFRIRFNRVYGCLSFSDKKSNWEKSLPFYNSFVHKNQANISSKYNLRFNLYYNKQKATIEDFIKNAKEGYFEYLVNKK